MTLYQIPFSNDYSSMGMLKITNSTRENRQIIRCTDDIDRVVDIIATTRMWYSHGIIYTGLLTCSNFLLIKNSYVYQCVDMLALAGHSGH